MVENPVVRPGEQLHCTVTVQGGGADVEAEVKVGTWPARVRGRRVAPHRQETGFFFPESAGRGRSGPEAVFVARGDAVDLHPGGWPPATFGYADMDPAKWAAALDAHIPAHWTR